MYAENQIREIIANSCSRTDACKNLNFCTNRHGLKKVDALINLYNIDISHFNRWNKHRQYIVEKQCPVCNEFFKTSTKSKKEKTTCSHACSNTFFRTGRKNGKYRLGAYCKDNKSNSLVYRADYRAICFNYYEHKCALCDWNIILDVHHIDGDNKNNDIKNLIPLCPNHHKMLHLKKYNSSMNKAVEWWKSCNP